MLRRPPRRRAGFSLVEVMVALFIMAAGMIALLTLFPLGAVQSARAMRDDRSQQTALQADGKLREWWRRSVVETPTPTDPAYLTLDGPVAGGPAIPRADRRASYPVLVDPIGVFSYTGTGKQTSAAGAGLFPRRSRTGPLTLTQAINLCTLPDDMEFAGDGTPANREGLALSDPLAAGSPSVFRAGRFNWAAVIQRPDNSNPAVADLKILVFDQRAPGVNPTAPNNELTFPNAAFPAAVTLTVGQNQFSIANVTNDTLGLRRGSWILDGTLDAATGIRNGQFYQVQSVAEVTGGVLIELTTPVARPRGDGTPAGNSYNAQIYLFSELIDVYDRPQLTPSGYSKQTP